MKTLLNKIVSLWNIFRLAVGGGEANILEGNINRAIILLAIPMILEMVMESLFAVVDIYFVSSVGVNAIAAVGLTESLMTITYSLGWGLAMGTTALVSRRIGEGDIRGAAISAVQAIYLGIIISAPLMAIGIFYAGDLLAMMGAQKPVVEEGMVYTQLLFASNLIIILLFLINGVFRGAGDAALAMRTLIISNGINIVLDPLLILGVGPFPELGLKGAAIATIIGRSTGVSYQFYHLFKSKGIIKIHREYWKWQIDVVKKLIKLSAEVTAQFIIGSASWIFLMRIISTFGSNALAGYTVTLRVLIFTILPAWGFSNAAATMVGQNLGAKQPDRAEKAVRQTGLFNLIFMGAVMIIYLIFSREIADFFTDDIEVISSAAECLFILSLGYLFYAYGMVLVQAFNGAGDTRTPTYMHFFIFWLIQIPLAYLLAIKFGFNSSGVYWAIVITESIFTIVGYFLFKRGRWKTIKI
ncbi:MAG: MATE family efflux transporter [Ignavibacteria bacterium]|nr:MATE family efflux transporter [Ignavibacteria bacterium]MBT8383329.1 MATE family efflux transporter [Ignavibacteria bacterium]MBT8391401.1 MATE family efflux transporter [Ignavibacteria bacterium]NNJ52421.1 MATE family efflux transporter [Ignavibacteriaceae bacterium]NNL19839.1 MATE family efflux transporter [Ignavibacteriaceae bacterium]